MNELNLEGLSLDCYDGEHRSCKGDCLCACLCACHVRPRPTVGPTVKGKAFRVTRLDAEGNPTGETTEVPLSTVEFAASMDMNEVAFPETDLSVTMDITFCHVDPDTLALLTPDPWSGDLFAVEVYHPGRRRTFWEWLRRKPKHLAWMTYIPYARMEEEN